MAIEGIFWPVLKHSEERCAAMRAINRNATWSDSLGFDHEGLHVRHPTVLTLQCRFDPPPTPLATKACGDFMPLRNPPSLPLARNAI